MGPKREGESRPRSIVAKFTLFKERELVRHQGSELKGHPVLRERAVPKGSVRQTQKVGATNEGSPQPR
ncbi:hypothetical protein DPMN_020704 [Dreissena polymorpha]|uniref:Uncharacterized protein n=1 Tax=Dreissena polymorpha TaxID=45954 RepID=A0A9D4RYI7_DREPO|nr:hypothetical protein DPMN_003669 [Dreissena polymorpha]KAH3883663.1 hypothetical protein DPMN_007623 [Dreissena polymorpha]KAH3896527.1 hypothetical protein DPMN_020704 [Dreissena polymorpha]